MKNELFAALHRAMIKLFHRIIPNPMNGFPRRYLFRFFNNDLEVYELTKACELMSRIIAEQKEKERLRFKLKPTVAEVDMAMRCRGRPKKAA